MKQPKVYVKYLNKVLEVESISFDTKVVVVYDEDEQIKILNRGLAFKTVEEAQQYDKERILLFKLHKWAEMKNGDWEPEWSDINENKYYIYYDHSMGSERLRIDLCWISEKFSKLPYFKTIEIARECVDLFGDEIKEVLC